ncbi:MAG: DUF2027 domain-containing protein [Prevotella sp.]|nr:DUF2027 domain-containing protein [Prevotella sp.]
MVKIGDKVRFLNEVGGGRISGFQSKNIVLVEDEDGFEIPVLASDVVVVESDDYSSSKMVAAADNSLKTNALPCEENVSAGLVTTTEQAVEERKGGDKIFAYVAFVPVNIKDFSATTFECYFVNDCNYFLHYVILTVENDSCRLLFEGEVEPNTKDFLAEYTREDVNNFSRLTVQLLAFKRDKPFLPKAAVSVQFRLDPVKFYKLHAFADNAFFDSPALLFPLVENDVPRRELVIDSKQLRKAMAEKQTESREKIKTVKKKGRDEVVVIDLHAAELLDTTAGMSAGDILNYQLKVFNDTLAEYAADKGRKIIFIHGKVEGVLRRAIVNQLAYKYKKYQYQDASFAEYGYGATQVIIR